jgi:hypothetical protein
MKREVLGWIDRVLQLELAARSAKLSEQASSTEWINHLKDGELICTLINRIWPVSRTDEGAGERGERD